MKKVLIVLGLLLFMICSYSQETFKFRTIAVAASEFNKETEEYNEWSDWEKTKILIFYNINEGVIKIDNNFNDEFYLRSVPEVNETVDKQGNEVIELRAKAYDQNQIPVIIKIRTWTHDNSAQFYIYYTNVRYVYDAKQLNVKSESDSDSNKIST